MWASARSASLAIWLLLSSLSVVHALPAAPGGRPPAASGWLAVQGGVGPDQAAAAVRERTGGRVLNVRAVRRGGKQYFRVKVLLDRGQVRAYLVDARTGQVVD